MLIPIDCPTCGSSIQDCLFGRAKGWDNCCMRCDEVGQKQNHHKEVTEINQGRLI